MGDARDWLGQFAGPLVSLHSHSNWRLLRRGPVVDDLLLSGHWTPVPGAPGADPFARVARAAAVGFRFVGSGSGPGQTRLSVRHFAMVVPAVGVDALRDQIRHLVDFLRVHSGRLWRPTVVRF